MVLLDRLFFLLKERGIQQKDLAKKIKLSPSVFSDWKKGRIKPSIEVMERISTELDVSIDYLLGKTDDPMPGNKKATPEERLLSESKKKMYNEVEGINDEEAIKVLEFAEFLKSQRKK